MGGRATTISPQVVILRSAATKDLQWFFVSLGSRFRIGGDLASSVAPNLFQ